MDETITAIRDDRYVTVRSPYWSARHDLQRGGCLDDLRVFYGTNRNLLATPCHAVVNIMSEVSDTDPHLSIHRAADRITIAVKGYMGAGLHYEHEYVYTPWSMHNRLMLIPDSVLTVRNLAPLTLTASNWITDYAWGTADFEKHPPRYAHVLGAHYDDLLVKCGGARGRLQEDAMRPWAVTFIHRGWEGFQWCGDSKIHQWDRLSGQRAFRLSGVKKGLRLELAPVSGGALRLSQPLEFGWYLILPNVRRLGRPRYNEVGIITQPFPSEAMLTAWEKSGVNLLRIHEDFGYKSDGEEFWHDGRHPPFGPAKMRELARFIKAAHRHGMKIIPYFSGWELAPDTSLFAKHAEEWYSPAKSGGCKRYTRSGRMGVYGCLMCPDTGWAKALEKNIRRAIDGLGFDGFYLDWSQPAPCYSDRHLPGPHNGIDGLHAMLERLRADYPDKTIVIHSGGQAMWLLHHNIADQYVTFEEGLRNRKKTVRLENLPVTTDYMGACSGSMVPCQLWGKEPVKCAKLYPGLAYAVLLGIPPYSYNFQYDNYGYADWKENVQDPRGDFSAMRQYARFDWSQYHFYSVNTDVSTCRSRQVKTAVYLGERNGVLVAANITARTAAATTANVRADRTPFIRGTVEIPVPALKAWEWRLIYYRVTFANSGELARLS